MENQAIIIAIIGALVSLASVVTLAIKSRGENETAKTNSKTALDKRIDDRVEQQLESSWHRLDEVETQFSDLQKEFQALEARENRRTGAITRILKAIAKQWPAGVEGPNLDPADIAEIEETIPVSWIRKPKSTT